MRPAMNKTKIGRKKALLVKPADITVDKKILPEP